MTQGDVCLAKFKYSIYYPDVPDKQLYDLGQLCPTRRPVQRFMRPT